VVTVHVVIKQKRNAELHTGCTGHAVPRHPASDFAVLCTGRALHQHLSPTSAASPVSPMAPAHRRMAPPLARVPKGTSSWLRPKAFASPTCKSPNPLSINSLSAAAASAGAPADQWDHQRRTAYGGAERSGYVYVPLSVESYGCIG
jgi:hypothetical protein